MEPTSIFSGQVGQLLTRATEGKSGGEVGDEAEIPGDLPRHPRGSQSRGWILGREVPGQERGPQAHRESRSKGVGGEAQSSR